LIQNSETGAYTGLLQNLRDGDNVVHAKGKGRPASITIYNSSRSGPVFAGPKLLPWTCLNQDAEDADCNQPTTYSFFYKSTNPTQAGMIPYDTENPPSDVAMTTTDEGQTVPFVVRLEAGYIDRDLYNIAVLFDPAKPWSAISPQSQFNGKLLINHGFGCAVEYQNATELAVFVVPGTGTDPIGGRLFASRYSLACFA